MLIAEAQTNMTKAAQAQETKGTVYHGHQAIALLLGGILMELDAIREQLEANK